MKKNADPELVVYAVWFKMLSSDDRGAHPNSLHEDTRVVELWDEPRILGRWLASQPQFGDKGLVGGGVMWDTFLLFGRESRWEGVPTYLLSWGHTIVDARKRLEADLPFALAPAGRSVP